MDNRLVDYCILIIVQSGAYTEFEISTVVPLVVLEKRRVGKHAPGRSDSGQTRICVHHHRQRHRHQKIPEKATEESL